MEARPWRVGVGKSLEAEIVVPLGEAAQVLLLIMWPRS